MEILPHGPEQAHYLYNVWMLVATSVTSYFLHSWLPFFVVVFWCAAWSWDLYIVPWLEQQTPAHERDDLPEPERLQRTAAEQLARSGEPQQGLDPRQLDRVEKKLGDMMQRIQDLERSERERRARDTPEDTGHAGTPRPDHVTEEVPD